MNKTLTQQVQDDTQEYSELMEKLAEQKEAEVIVEGTAYPGTTVNIGELSMIVKKPVQYSKFVVKEGDVYDRYNDLRTCLTTMEKYESTRLRS